MKLDKVLHDKFDTVVKSMGYDLVGVEVQSQGRSMLLRVYIDCAKGVTVDACSSISRQLGAMLDVEDPFQGRYSLEVSSPGVDRPLFALEQYEKYVGQTIKLRLHLPVDGRRQYKGVLLQVESGQIYLRVDGVEQKVVVPFSAIDKANLVAEVGFKKTK